ncbi:type III PLP-dependent enzyme [Actinomadura rudentiformis]|uniref:Type III PLP-dependent enzyme n=2 Tax=Actinomadura rudentiformis TaxID=359158 RepID=A0A6H9YR33_9ACTN|nr:type III PLP-dependent enzyme [Actinomadura rudentiformis]
MNGRYAELAARFGTPLYVYDLDEAEAARRELAEALPDGVEIFYALKANPHPELVRALRCRPEISSTGELAAALAAGAAGADCLYTGPGKTAGELREAIARGVRAFSAESATDVEHIGAAARERNVVADVLLRINAASASATTGIRMTGTPTQFGFDCEALPAVMPRLRRARGVRLAGLHFFPLSNATDEAALTGEFQATIELAARLAGELELPLRLVDIGGGFAAPYAVPGRRASYPKLRSDLESALDLHLHGWRDGEPQIACESGRYLISGAGTLVASVSNVKVSRGRKFVILDAGINALGGLSGLGRLLPVEVGPDSGEPVERASLVGPLCTPGDILGRQIEVPALGPGDLVTVPNVGAYGVTASLLAFLGRPAPVEVIVRGEEVVSVSRLEYARRHQVSSSG